jgi:glycosyltransferase involved in cell wall biosynthesis
MSSLAAAFVLTDAGVDAVRQTYPGLPAGRVKRLHYPIDPARDEEHPKPGAPFTVGFFGYWYLGKGLELLVDAVARMARDGQPIRARLWGDVSPQAGRRPGERYREHVLEHAREARVTDALQILGFLDSDEVVASLQTCDVIVLPYELGSGVQQLRSTSAVMYEALAAGTPVVAADVRALNEVIDHDHNGFLFPAGDVSALVQHLRTLRDDPTRRARLRAGARQTGQSFTARRAAEEALATYREILST